MKNQQGVKIRRKGAPCLTMVASPVNEGSDIRPLIDMMFEVMYRYAGIGLAAPQIGVTNRVIVLHANGLKQEFINPEIVKRYGGKATSKEGCLSLPGVQVNVIRDRQVIVRGFDRNWKPIKRKLKGLASFVAQHEVDHLNGVLIK